MTNIEIASIISLSLDGRGAGEGDTQSAYPSLSSLPQGERV